MCRLLTILGTFDQQSCQRWLSSWIDASEKDPLLKMVAPQLSLERCQHDDGWGAVTTFFDVEHHALLDVRFLRSVMPVKRCDLRRIESITASPRDNGSHSKIVQLSTFHSRKASPNTPKSLFQSHPIPIHVESSQKSLFLAHNGSVSRDVIHEMLSSDHRLTAGDSLLHYSDTEMLSWLVKEWYQGRDQEPTWQDWMAFFQNLKKEHEDFEQSFSMMIHLIVITPTIITFVLISSLSGDNVKKMDYYRQYHHYNSSLDNHVFCSSTVYHRFQESLKNSPDLADDDSSQMIFNGIENNEMIYWDSRARMLLKKKL